jgi:hypothetical protein
MIVKILGSGCSNCKRLEESTLVALRHLKIEAQIIKVTEYADMMVYDIMSTPGLVVEEQLLSSGKVLSPSQIEGLLKEHGFA